MPNQRQTGFDKYADVEPVTAKNDKYNYQLEIRFNTPAFLMPSLIIVSANVALHYLQNKVFVCLYFGNKLNNYILNS
jgi:hypothetical protein